MAVQSAESRYRQATEEVDSEGRLVLSERVPLVYSDREDNISYVTREGDTWQSIAQAYYSGISSRACGLYWVVMDYQVPRVVDPTLRIEPGTVVVLPSPETVLAEVFAAKREVFQ